MPELQAVLDVFRKQKDSINMLIKDFKPLEPRNQEEMTAYLKEFFEIIEAERLGKVDFYRECKNSIKYFSGRIPQSYLKTSRPPKDSIFTDEKILNS